VCRLTMTIEFGFMAVLWPVSSVYRSRRIDSRQTPGHFPEGQLPPFLRVS